jgi:hypothetical protein
MKVQRLQYFQQKRLQTLSSKYLHCMRLLNSFEAHFIVLLQWKYM